MLSAGVDRRSLLGGAAGLGALSALGGLLPGWAKASTMGAAAGPGVLSGEAIRIDIGQRHMMIGGQMGHAMTANGTVPGPLVRLKEGQHVRLSVANALDEDTSIHWHGLIVPFQFDGVPGISFPGIKPGTVFDYEFPIKQAGTYWYHSHSNMQEAMGLYGPIVIDPLGEEPAPYDREHILVLSDWSSVHPHVQLRRLKQMGGYYNHQKQTLAGLLAGKDQSLSERIEWGKMRMDPTDISDVTRSAYSYLINGHDSAGNWSGLFAPGERVRLRFINASSMTNFNVRLPGIPMTVVQADGQDVDPIEIDEFQIGIAETLDVIVRPDKAEAIAIIAEAIDRSGLCRATLAPQIGMVAALPPLRERPLLGMKDMGMDMSGMDMASGTLDLSAPADAPSKGGHGSMKMRDKSLASPQIKMGPGVATISAAPADRLGDKPTGLENVDHRVLTYADLKALVPSPDRRAPSRELNQVPHRAAEILSASGITSIYVPRELGGLGASIETVVETVRIISAADGGVGQLLQIHNVMIRGVFARPDDAFRTRLIADIFAGKRFGNALAEGKGKGKGGGTRLSLDSNGIWRLNGRKTFATGCYLAEWISISATSDQGPAGVLLHRDTPGLTLEDDWEAFGQQHSVSGSVSFDNVEVDPRFAPKEASGGSPDFMPRTGLTWPQILHAAIDTGIARGALEAATAYIRENMRPWHEAGVEHASEETHSIKRIGEYAVAVRSAESALRYAARTFDRFKADPGNRALEDELILAVATARAQSDEASIFIGSDIFALTGANSTLARWNLQRYWADARVHTTHDPIRWRIYHIGNFYLNGIPPDEYGRAARLRQQEIAIATNAPAPHIDAGKEISLP